MRSTRSVLLRLGGIAAALSLGGCFAMFNGLFEYSASGALTLQQGDAAPQTLLPEQCQAGELRGFLGFDIAARQGDWRVRALDDPLQGVALRLTLAGEDTLLHPIDCSVLHLDAQRSGVSINDVASWSGTLDVHCANAAGVQLSGRISVHNCPGN